MGRLWAAQELLRSLGQLGGGLETCGSTGGLCELWSSWGALKSLELLGSSGALELQRSLLGFFHQAVAWFSFGASEELSGSC